MSRVMYVTPYDDLWVQVWWHFIKKHNEADVSCNLILPCK